MAYEWVSPTVTGVVGVAGIAGTLLVSQGSRKAAADLSREARATERASAMRDERRAAYTGYLSALYDTARLLPGYKDARIEAGPGEPREIFTEVTESIHSLELALQSVRLTAPDDVRQAAETMFMATLKVIQDLKDEKVHALLPAAPETSLINGMRTDLGHSSPDTNPATADRLRTRPRGFARFRRSKA